MPWKTLRLQFPVTDRFAYLNHAAVAPLPLRCTMRMQEYIHELSGFGANRYETFIPQTLTRARSLAASLLHAPETQVFFVRSTTQGIAIAATGIPFKEGDNVVLAEKEFPANLRPWLPLRKKGVETRFVPQTQGRISLDDLAAAIDHRTRAVSLSFVQFLSGFRLDLAKVAELCRAHDALFVVDAIQGLGAFPVDVVNMGVDFLSADAHKWLLGPEGVGIGYASERALRRIEPSVQGWLSVKNPFDFFDLEQPLKTGADRFEEGAYNLIGIHGLTGSLELLVEKSGMGPSAIQSRILYLTDHVCDRLQSIGWKVLSPRASEDEKSGIVLATKEGVGFESLQQTLADKGIAVSVRGGALRVSPHAYNSTEDIDRLVEELRSSQR